MIRLYRRRSVMLALFGMLISAAVATPALAEVGAVSVVFTKGGFIVGVGGGQGVLDFRGRRYPFTVSGERRLHVGASTTNSSGRALNCEVPGILPGAYSAGGAGGALAAGAGGVQLQNANGVILQLSGPKVGVELRPPWAGLPSQCGDVAVSGARRTSS